MKGVFFKDDNSRDFPAGPVVKNLPYNVGDTGSVPGQGQGTKLPYATGQLSLCVAATEPTSLRARKLQRRSDTAT